MLKLRSWLDAGGTLWPWEEDFWDSDHDNFVGHVSGTLGANITPFYTVFALDLFSQLAQGQASLSSNLPYTSFACPNKKCTENQQIFYFTDINKKNSLKNETSVLIACSLCFF